MAHCLEGKTITQIDIASDKKALRFVIDSHDAIVAKCDGDCCSGSWIEHVSLPAGGLPAKVIGVDSIDLPGSTYNRDRGECIQVYGLKIVTDRGDLVIDYRNSSNGYYGGNLAWPGEYFYGGVHGQNDSTCEFISLKEDI